MFRWTSLRLSLLVAGPLLLVASFFCARGVIDHRNGCQDRLRARANEVNSGAILRRDIPGAAQLPAEDIRLSSREAPGPSGVNLLTQRAESAVAAAQIFDDLCLNGWSSEQLNERDRAYFTTGGSGDHRYCASHVIQNRFYLGYVPFCGSSERHISYVIVQRGEVLFAAYEATSIWQDTGQPTNEALAETISQLGLKAQ